MEGRISYLDQLLLQLADAAERGVLWVPIRDIHITPHNNSPNRHYRHVIRTVAARVGLTYRLIDEKYVSTHKRQLRIKDKGIERLVYKGLMSRERAEEIREKIKIALALSGGEGER